MREAELGRERKWTAMHLQQMAWVSPAEGAGPWDVFKRGAEGPGFFALIPINRQLSAAWRQLLSRESAGEKFSCEPQATKMFSMKLNHTKNRRENKKEFHEWGIWQLTATFSTADPWHCLDSFTSSSEFP